MNLIWQWPRNVIDRLAKCCTKEQYSCREWLEISGIPEFIQDDGLEDCVTKIFNECNTSVDPANIEPYHRLKSKARPKKVIIKLSKRKDVFNILQCKKKLKSVDITKVGLPQGSLVFTNQSLCSYYKYLWFLYKKAASEETATLFLGI